MEQFEYRLLFLVGVFISVIVILSFFWNYNIKKLNERLDKKKSELIVISDKLSETEAMYKSIMNASPDAITVIDSDGKIVMASPSAKKIFGISNEDIIGKPVANFISKNNHSKLELNINKIVKGEKVGPSEYEALHIDGHIFSIEVNSDLIIDNKKGDNKVLSVIKDITDKIISEEIIRKKEEKYRLLVKELEEKNNILNKVVINDKLTGINNRYYFDKRIIEEMGIADRYSTPLSLLVFDLDRFKYVNDTFGHDIGDKVLITLSDKVKRLMRKTDIFARWGGEEFVILMTHTNLDGATCAAEKIRKEAEAIYYMGVGNVTISIGVAQRLDNESLDSWFKRADRALYRAKKEGRNRVCADIEEKEQVFVDMKWQDSWNSGHMEIDSQHKKLLRLVNSIIETIFKEESYEVLGNKLSNLLEHLEYHFEYEERLLRELGYEYEEDHRWLHKELIKKLNDLIEKQKNVGDITHSDIFEFIVGELVVEHLVKEDYKFFELLN